MKLLILGFMQKKWIDPVFFKKNEKTVKFDFHDGLIWDITWDYYVTFFFFTEITRGLLLR